MKKIVKITLAVFAVFAVFCIISIICQNEIKTEEKSLDDFQWQDITPIPFSGHICGYTDSDIHIQIPALIQGENNAQFNGFLSVYLLGENTLIECTNFTLRDTVYNDELFCTNVMLNMRVNLPQEGQYSVNTLRIETAEGEVLDKELGNIIFSVVNNKEQKDELEINSSWLNQNDLSSMQITYTNKLSEPISVLGIEFPGSSLKNNKTQVFLEWDCQNETDSKIIPAGESRTFIFDLETLSNQKDYAYFLALPFLIYRINGCEHKIPAQRQPTVIEQPLEPEYIQSLLEKNNVQ